MLVWFDTGPHILNTPLQYRTTQGFSGYRFVTRAGRLLELSSELQFRTGSHSNRRYHVNGLR